MQRNEIINVIYNALANINEERGDGDKVVVNENTCLFGLDSELDSLELVSMIVDVETNVSSMYKPISLTDEKTMTREISPFVTVNSLADYIEELLS